MNRSQLCEQCRKRRTYTQVGARWLCKDCRVGVADPIAITITLYLDVNSDPRLAAKALASRKAAITAALVPVLGLPLHSLEVNTPPEPEVKETCACGHVGRLYDVDGERLCWDCMA